MSSLFFNGNRILTYKVKSKHMEPKHIPLKIVKLLRVTKRQKHQQRRKRNINKEKIYEVC